jgi:hypothetical protein
MTKNPLSFRECEKQEAENPAVPCLELNAPSLLAQTGQIRAARIQSQAY